MALLYDTTIRLLTLICVGVPAARFRQPLFDQVWSMELFIVDVAHQGFVIPVGVDLSFGHAEHLYRFTVIGGQLPVLIDKHDALRHVFHGQVCNFLLIF